jgi:hypothetical protein
MDIQIVDIRYFVHCAFVSAQIVKAVPFVVAMAKRLEDHACAPS